MFRCICNQFLSHFHNGNCNDKRKRMIRIHMVKWIFGIDAVFNRKPNGFGTYFVPRSAGHFKRSASIFSLATARASWNNFKSYSVTYPLRFGSLCFVSPFCCWCWCWCLAIGCRCRTGDGGFGTKFERISAIFIWKDFCSTDVTPDIGSNRMVAFFRSSSFFKRSSRRFFVSSSETLWYNGHASCVKCLSDEPPKWPFESQPSTGHFRSSTTGTVFFGTFAFSLELILELVAFPFVRFTGLFDGFTSASDSDGSDAFVGLKIAAGKRNRMHLK